MNNGERYKCKEIIKLSFWAKDCTEESEIFGEFLEVLNFYSDYQIFHYGKYEKHFFNRMQSQFGGKYKEELSKLIDRSIDLYKFIYPCIYFPTYTNSLKEISKFLGYKWRHDNLLPLQSVIWRKRWELSKDNSFKQKVLLYNMDDCISLSLLLRTINKISNNLDIENSIEFNDYSDFKPDVSGKKFKPEFQSVDLEFINKTAYFDYQREKVLIRTNPKIKKAIEHKKPKLAPNQYVDIGCNKCPGCKQFGIKIDSEIKNAKTSIDIKSSRKVIKRWLITYLAFKYRCDNCDKTFYPPKFLKKDKYEHGLRAWIVYQYVVNKLSYKDIQRYLMDLFNISINVPQLHKLKVETANYYNSTYKKIKRNILEREFLHVDETEISLQDGKGYVWVFANYSGVYFLYRPTRHSDFLSDFLYEFRGILITDFYSGYDSLKCKKQRCLVHLIRDLNDDLRKNPYDSELKSIVDKFTILMKEIVLTIDAYGLRKRNLKKHKKEVEKFYLFLARYNPESKFGKHYKTRFLKYNDELFTFLDYDGITWNNNFAENSIKQFAKWRRQVKGRVKESGVQDYCLFRSIYLSCQYNGIDFLNFLMSKKKKLV